MALHRNDPQVEGKDAYYRCVTKPMETVILLSSCHTEVLEAGKTYRGHSCLFASGSWCGRRVRSWNDIATQIHCHDAAGCDGPRRNSAKKDSSTEKVHLCEQGYIVICQSLGHLVNTD